MKSIRTSYFLLTIFVFFSTDIVFAQRQIHVTESDEQITVEDSTDNNIVGKAYRKKSSDKITIDDYKNGTQSGRTIIDFKNESVESLRCTNMMTSDGECVYHDNGTYNSKDVPKAEKEKILEDVIIFKAPDSEE